MVISYHTLILVTAAFLTRVYAQVAPTWTTSNYLQAGSKLIINGNACNCKTGNSSTPTASVTFATAFAEAPHLGYGTSSYEGIQ
jgi:hypothetical protein